MRLETWSNLSMYGLVLFLCRCILLIYIYIYIVGGDSFSAGGKSVDLFTCVLIYLSILCKLVSMYLNSCLYFAWWVVGLVGGWLLLHSLVEVLASCITWIYLLD